MTGIFITLLNMSITASYMVAAAILLRFLLKKAPTWIRCVLWGLVGVRLVFPFSVESVLSLIPSAETVVPVTSVPIASGGGAAMPSADFIIHSGIPIIDRPAQNYFTAAQNGAVAAEKMPGMTDIAAVIWLFGAAAMIVYAFVSLLRVRGCVRGSVKTDGMNVYFGTRIPTPFILGLLRPKIYIPATVNIADIPYILAHERAHLRRLDHIWKPLGFGLLAVYWFNPVIWVAYVLLCRDIELACDEKVLSQEGTHKKKAYSNALLNCAVRPRFLAACPVAFGEVGVRARIKNVLSYKKPAFWVIIVSVLVCTVAAVCFLTDPVKKSEKQADPRDAEESSPVEAGGENGGQLQAPVSDLSGREDSLEVGGYIYSNHLASYAIDSSMNLMSVSQSGGVRSEYRLGVLEAASEQDMLPLEEWLSQRRMDWDVRIGFERENVFVCKAEREIYYAVPYKRTAEMSDILYHGSLSVNDSYTYIDGSDTYLGGDGCLVEREAVPTEERYIDRDGCGIMLFIFPEGAKEPGRMMVLDRVGAYERVRSSLFIAGVWADMNDNGVADEVSVTGGNGGKGTVSVECLADGSSAMATVDEYAFEYGDDIYCDIRDGMGVIVFRTARGERALSFYIDDDGQFRLSEADAVCEDVTDWVWLGYPSETR